MGYDPGVQDTAIVLVIVLIVVVIWRGPRTLPQLGAMLGRGVKSARRQVEQARSDKPGDDTRA